MSKTGLLIKAQLINFSRINELKRADNGKRSRFITSILGIILLILFGSIYNMITAKALVEVGQGEIIPAYMVSLSSFSILFLTIFYSNNILFSSRDLETLLSLPVKHSHIISSKFMFMYVMNFLIASLFIVPGGLIWVANSTLSLPHILLYFFSLFLVPLIPMCLAACIGIVIVLASSLFKSRNTLALVFSLLAIGIIGYLAISAMNSGREGSNIGIMLAEQLSSLYPLARLFIPSNVFSADVGIGIFIIVSLVIFAGFIKLVAFKYTYLHKLAKTGSRYHASKRVYDRKSIFPALYKKEMSRFLGSYMAVLNAGLGVIFLSIFSLFLLFSSVDDIGKYLGMENMAIYLEDYAPLVIASMLSLSCPAASSISLEGNNVWILQSSPVQVKTILNAKIAVNLTLHFIGYILSMIAFTLKFDMTLSQLLTIILVPIGYSLFTTIVGIFLNKKWPNYNWDSEMMVVKQSAPVLLSGLIGMFASAVPLLLTGILKFPIIPTLQVVTVILLIITGVIYSKIRNLHFI